MDVIGSLPILVPPPPSSGGTAVLVFLAKFRQLMIASQTEQAQKHDDSPWSTVLALITTRHCYN
jgi:hypothetical protein